MIAGSGSIFEQQFGIHPIIGALMLTVLVILTLVLNVKRVISAISSITPFLLVLIFIITIYSILTSDVSNATLVESASAHNSAAPNLLIESMLYVSYILLPVCPCSRLSTEPSRIEKLPA